PLISIIFPVPFPHSWARLFSFYCYCALRSRHSFPTRRSSDLAFDVIWRKLHAMLATLLSPNLMPIVIAAAAFLVYAILRPEQASDRKSTRLNSSHVKISYAVFCLKKKIYNDKRTRILTTNKHR